MSKCTHTLPYRGYELFITFDYTPAEAMTREYPGCPEELEIEKVELTTYRIEVRGDQVLKVSDLLDLTDLLEPQFPELATALLELKEDR